MPITNTVEADKAMAKIAQLKSKIKKFEEDAQAKIEQLIPETVSMKITNLQVKASEKAMPLKQEICTLENELADYVESSADELFVDAKAIKLNAGEFGVRETKSTQVDKTTVERIEALKTHPRTPEFNQVIELPTAASQEEADVRVRDLVTAAIKINKSARKNILEKWNDALLDLVAARRVIKDKFWYKLTGDSEKLLREIER